MSIIDELDDLSSIPKEGEGQHHNTRAIRNKPKDPVQVERERILKALANYATDGGNFDKPNMVMDYCDVMAIINSEAQDD